MSAELTAHGSKLTIMFDKPLVVQPITTANWIVSTEESGDRSPIGATVIGLPADAVQLMFAPSVESPVEVMYSADPPDVVGAPPNGQEVVAFTFPLT